jgi:hypothetical protein
MERFFQRWNIAGLVKSAVGVPERRDGLKDENAGGERGLRPFLSFRAGDRQKKSHRDSLQVFSRLGCMVLHRAP